MKWLEELIYKRGWKRITINQTFNYTYIERFGEGVTSKYTVKETMMIYKKTRRRNDKKQT